MWEGWRSECGSRLFYLGTIIAVLHPLSSKHGHASVWALSSIIFSRSNLHEVSQYSFLLEQTVPVYERKSECSCWWRMNNVSICWHQNRIKYGFQLRYNISCMHLHNVYTQEGQIKTRPSFAESYECQQVHIPQRTCSELQVWEQ